MVVVQEWFSLFNFLSTFSLSSKLRSSFRFFSPTPAVPLAGVGESPVFSFLFLCCFSTF